MWREPGSLIKTVEQVVALDFCFLTQTYLQGRARAAGPDSKSRVNPDFTKITSFKIVEFFTEADAVNVS